MDNKITYTTNVGDHLVIFITGCTDVYIAEVTQSEPLRLKVMEHGPLNKLTIEDAIIHEAETQIAQQDDIDNTCVFLQQRKDKGLKPAVSGLISLGVTDGLLREILPAS